jgi:hypothetical protein
MEATKLDLVEIDCLDIDEDEPIERADPEWVIDPDDEKYVTINHEIQKCPSCLRLENNEVRKQNIAIRKRNIGIKITGGDREPEIRPFKSVTTKFNVAKLEDGWTRYKCRKCGFVHMVKTLK